MSLLRLGLLLGLPVVVGLLFVVGTVIWVPSLGFEGGERLLQTSTFCLNLG